MLLNNPVCISSYWVSRSQKIKIIRFSLGPANTEHYRNKRLLLYHRHLQHCAEGHCLVQVNRLVPCCSASLVRLRSFKCFEQADSAVKACRLNLGCLWLWSQCSEQIRFTLSIGIVPRQLFLFTRAEKKLTVAGFQGQLKQMQKPSNEQKS